MTAQAGPHPAQDGNGAARGQCLAPRATESTTLLMSSLYLCKTDANKKQPTHRNTLLNQTVMVYIKFLWLWLNAT